MRPVAAALFFAAALAAQNPLARPDLFVGVFQGDQVVLDLKGAAGQYTGTLTDNGTSLATTVKSAGASATGTFAAGGTSYSYTLTPAGRGLVLNSEGNEYRLERKSESPATAAAPAGSSAAGRAAIQPMCNLESEWHLPLGGPDGQLQP